MDLYTSVLTIGIFLVLICRLSLAAIFLVAGIAKLVDQPGTRKAIQDYGFSEKLSVPLAVLIPVVELTIVIFVLSAGSIWYGALGALVMLAVFTLIMLLQLARGKAHDCHCFGQIYSQAIGPKSIVKNLLMMLPAFYLLSFVPRARLADFGQALNGAIDPSISPQFTFGLALLVVLGVAVFYLKRLTDGQRELNLRLDRLELSGEKGGHTHQHHDEMSSPEEGLPIGAPVPDFELPDMNGRAVSFEQLLMRGKAMLFFFISPTCGPCKALLPEIGKWQEEFAGKIEFIFISTGSVQENSAKLQQLGGQTLLLQKKREIAEFFKTKWTPTALLVNAEGNFASRPAAGDTAIRDMIDMIREKIDHLDFVENGRGMSPNEMKMGQMIPDFSLPEVNGESVTDALISGKKTLALFWGTDCPFCKEMLPSILEWESGTREQQLIVFSTGDIEANKAMRFKSPLVIDDRNEISNKMGMFGTPSAVLIDESGKIVSETAIGADRIYSLIGKRKLGEA